MGKFPKIRSSGKNPIARFRIAMTPKSDRPLASARLVLVSGPDVSFTISNSRLGNFLQPNWMHLNFLSVPVAGPLVPWLPPGNGFG
ncbi:MAG: hypothetical protein GDA56_17540 [Hormoscilla sp. GM7CHS1pb]|nr:hypothetical protein [Hormoscilla sp. GM7CHS1pb]